MNRWCQPKCIPPVTKNDPGDICQFDLLGQQLADHLLTWSILSPGLLTGLGKDRTRKCWVHKPKSKDILNSTYCIHIRIHTTVYLILDIWANWTELFKLNFGHFGRLPHRQTTLWGEVGWGREIICPIIFTLTIYYNHYIIIIYKNNIYTCPETNDIEWLWSSFTSVPLVCIKQKRSTPPSPCLVALTHESSDSSFRSVARPEKKSSQTSGHILRVFSASAPYCFVWCLSWFDVPMRI